eukprot:TRINITY_DN7895_c0_g1_i3.p1 TRINITY_DN7895_c0_g1~~TRINITY_DN7895_c0_g1_i3.p1  ORF type:complete len:320 (-),score=31.88 TRINITY_DN7895_c0_g1_i3:106-993(-)
MNYEQEENEGNCLYVASLNPLTREKDLRVAFEKFGKVAECSLKIDPKTEISRGFAFVTMSTPQEAEDVIRCMNGVKFDDRVIKVELARRGVPRPHKETGHSTGARILRPPPMRLSPYGLPPGRYPTPYPGYDPRPPIPIPYDYVGGYLPRAYMDFEPRYRAYEDSYRYDYHKPSDPHYRASPDSYRSQEGHRSHHDHRSHEGNTHRSDSYRPSDTYRGASEYRSDAYRSSSDGYRSSEAYRSSGGSSGNGDGYSRSENSKTDRSTDSYRSSDPYRSSEYRSAPRDSDSYSASYRY